MSAKQATVADVLVDTLIDWGVDTIFGLPGDGINGIMEALRTRGDRVRFIQVRHEEAAAFMAVAYAKYTGRLGVCLATSGPGGVHLLNGLYDAKMDGQPVPLDRVFEDVAVYTTRVMGPSHIENVTDLACRKAIGYRGVAHINIASDLQRQPATRKNASPRNLPHHTADLRLARTEAADDDLAKAAAILNAGARVAILAGRGALGATEELEHIADVLGAPIIKALLGKAVVPDTSPYTTGGIGLLGTKPSVLAMEQCDTLLIVGSSFPYIEFYPQPGQARCVQIELDPARIGLRYATEVALVANARDTLRALSPLLERKPDRSFLEMAQREMATWRAVLADQGTMRDVPMKPQVVGYELNKVLPENAIVSWDSGTNTFWAARYLDIREGMAMSGSGLMASMACALPYANAAAIAYPERASIAFVGDGGMSMLLGELATTVKYRLNVKVIVISNNTLGQIKWEQMLFEGNPEYGVELQPIDFAKVAEGIGARGFTIARPEDAASVLAEAMRTPGPVVVNALVDPLEAPLPPKVSREQREHFIEALVRGEPNRDEILANVQRDRARQMV
jgi:pyruvate dehydrogenase (quinone)